jgi:hypothetical protein
MDIQMHTVWLFLAYKKSARGQGLQPQGDQFQMKTIAPYILLAAACLVLPSVAKADSVTTGSVSVNATDNIYAAGSQGALITNCVSVGYCGAGGQGTLPGYISVAGSTYITLTATGTITMNNYDPTPTDPAAINDPDGLYNGVPAYDVPASVNAGFESISGITAPGAGYLVGLFVGPDGPIGTAPASLTYTTADTEDTSYDPLLDQVFFIGDGLTGDGTGTNQEFYVPTGATELYLGISDACFFVGAPSCYTGNAGQFSVDYTDTTSTGTTSPSPAPEPSSLLLLATGALSAAGVMRRRLSV